MGNGLDPAVQMGPVISPASKTRIEQLIGKGLQNGGKAVLDCRNPAKQNGASSSFLNPTVLTDIGQQNELTTTEIFGPALAMQPANDLDQALEIVSRSAYGNAASIFTSSGNSARKFRCEAPTGNVGVNIGVAEPMAYFPFSGWKDSFLGVLHGKAAMALSSTWTRSRYRALAKGVVTEILMRQTHMDRRAFVRRPLLLQPGH